MPISRRKLLQGMAIGASAAALPGFAAAEFPAQSTIDNDPLRPRYHLMPRRGWMNDPCAPVYFGGRYHMFFQYNPGASVWGDMHWAHAVSEDMVHWRERPIALAPTAGGPDSYGVFTGTMVMDGGVPTILYTCVSPSSAELATLWHSHPPEREQQCLATPAGLAQTDPNARLDTWHKLMRPVILSPPEGMRVTGFRDPVPWREADGFYYLLVASGETAKGGNVLLYKSPDLRQWAFQHVFLQGKPNGRQADDAVDSGEMWECPDFFPLGDAHVLIHSVGAETGRTTVWQSGHLDRRTMHFQVWRDGVLNHGPYYAPKTQLDAAGNRILWGWIPEDRPEAAFAKAGWAGCMSLPRVLTLDNGWLRFRPADQVNRLRGPVTLGASGAHPEMENVIALARFTGPVGGPLPLPQRFQSGPVVMVEGSRFGTSPLRWKVQAIPLATALPEQAEIRIFVDHSVLEMFIGDRLVLTHRAYDGSVAELELPDGYTASMRSYPVKL